MFEFIDLIENKNLKILTKFFIYQPLVFYRKMTNHNYHVTIVTILAQNFDLDYSYY